MSKKTRTKEDTTKDMVVRVKSLITDLIVRTWLKTPVKEWGNRTPLQMIKSGDGDKLIEAIKRAEKEVPGEVEEEIKDGTDDTTVEDGPEEEGTHQCCNII